MMCSIKPTVSRFSNAVKIYPISFQIEPLQAAAAAKDDDADAVADGEPTYAELAASKRRGTRSQVTSALSSYSTIYATIDHTIAARNKPQSTKSKNGRMFSRKSKLQSSKSNHV